MIISMPKKICLCHFFPHTTYWNLYCRYYVERCTCFFTIHTYGDWSFSDYDGNFYKLKEYLYFLQKMPVEILNYVVLLWSPGNNKVYIKHGGGNKYGSGYSHHSHTTCWYEDPYPFISFAWKYTIHSPLSQHNQSKLTPLFSKIYYHYQFDACACIDIQEFSQITLFDKAEKSEIEPISHRVEKMW